VLSASDATGYLFDLAANLAAPKLRCMNVDVGYIFTNRFQQLGKIIIGSAFDTLSLCPCIRSKICRGKRAGHGPFPGRAQRRKLRGVQICSCLTEIHNDATIHTSLADVNMALRGIRL